MVECEPENYLGSWKIMFWCFLCILRVFYKLFVACPLSRRGFFLGQKVRLRIFAPAFVRFCAFSLILGSQGSHIIIFNFYLWL